MTINWPLTIILVLLCLPGIAITIPRIISFLLPDSSQTIKKRLSAIAVGQTVLMVFIMSLTGSILSKPTGLGAPFLVSLLKIEPSHLVITDILLPVFMYTIIGLFIFLILFYGLLALFTTQENMQILKKMRHAIGLDGCMLYSVVDEVMARWGILNVLIFFGFIFSGQRSIQIIWLAIILSSLMYTLLQLPAYLASGCKSSRAFVYALVILQSWQSIIFGYIFWQYGLLAAIVAHMLFHLFWWIYDRPDELV